MHTYDIRDVWTALKLAGKNFIVVLPLGWFLVYLVAVFSSAATRTDGEVYFGAITGPLIVAMPLLALIQSIVIYNANKRYLIDTETGLVTFPRSDMENSIMAIILLHPYWNLMRTKTIKCSEIENIYIDTKRWSRRYRHHKGFTSTGKARYESGTLRYVRYTINIAGRFGSANLQFLDRQKRDEVRNAIQQCVKQHSGKNVDRKVSEF